MKHIKKKFSVQKTSYGLGLFTQVEFKKGEFVIEYLGEKITFEEGERRGGKYLMTLDRYFTIDGKSRDNTARYINHSCKPNCVAYTDKGRVKIYAKRKIVVGEELTYHYGKDYFEQYIKPKGCKCGIHG